MQAVLPYRGGRKNGGLSLDISSLLLPVLGIFSAPLRWAVKLLLHALVGFAALFLLNFFGASLGISLELTWFNAIVTGVLGVPGVLLLLIFQYLI